MRLAGVFRLGAGDIQSTAFPIYVAPGERKRFGWDAKATEPDQSHEQPPRNVRATLKYAFDIADRNVSSPLGRVAGPMAKLFPRMRVRCPNRTASSKICPP